MCLTAYKYSYFKIKKTLKAPISVPYLYSSKTPPIKNDMKGKCKNTSLVCFVVCVRSRHIRPSLTLGIFTVIDAPLYIQFAKGSRRVWNLVGCLVFHFMHFKIVQPLKIFRLWFWQWRDFCFNFHKPFSVYPVCFLQNVVTFS